MTNISSKHQNMKEGSGNMTIILKKNEHYVAMSNYHLIDKRLSLKAKGLLSVILNFPNNWEFSVKGLIAICKEGRDSVRATLDELKQYGYITIRRIDPNADNNRITWEYIVCGNPEEMQDIKQENSQYTGFQYIENQDVENPDINKLTKNKISNNKVSKESKKRGSSLLIPTLEEVKEYCKERQNNIDPVAFYEYYNKGNWIDANGNPVKNWKQKVISWESHQKNKSNNSKTGNRVPDMLLKNRKETQEQQSINIEELISKEIREQEPKKTILDQKNPIPYNEPEPDLSRDSFDRMFE